MSDSSELDWGATSIVIGMLLLITLYGYRQAIIFMVFGIILVLVSSASTRLKVRWVTPPVVMMAIFYLIFFWKS